MRKNFTAQLLVIGCLLATGAAAEPFHPISEARYLAAMQRGKAAYDRGDFSASQKEFEKALALRPKSSEALNDLGESQYRSRLFGEAQKSFDQAGASPDTRARAAYQSGNSLFRQNKLEEAAASYRQALRWDEKDADARFNLQVALDRLKQQKQDKPKDDKSQSGKDHDDKSKGGKDKPKDDKSQSGKDHDDKSQGGKDKPKDDKSQSGQGKPDKSAGGKDRQSDQEKPDKARDGKDEPKDDKSPAGKDQSAQGGQSAAAQAGSKLDRAKESSNSPDGRGAKPRDDSDRILQYFQDQERQGHLKPTPGPNQSRPSQESW